MNTNEQNTTPAPATTPTFRRERMILCATVSALLSAGYTVRMHDGEETSEPCGTHRAALDFVVWNDTRGNRTLWNLDDFHVIAERDGKRASVWFIVSNGNEGRDVISDYSCSLESVLAPIMDAHE